jgi:hypothetical protein
MNLSSNAVGGQPTMGGLPDDILRRLPSDADAPRDTFLVTLGPLRFSIAVPIGARSCLRFFRECVACAPDTPSDFKVWLTYVAPSSDWSAISDAFDGSYRSVRLQRGYYVTEHFGPPAGLIIRENYYFLFGSDFSKLVWGYLVKALLTRWAVMRGQLHLKAAAFAMGEVGFLVVGRGGGGKTVLLKEACAHGASFISNTHVILDGSFCQGVATNVKVRADELFVGLEPHGDALIDGEMLIDPVKEFSWSASAGARIAKIVFVDYAAGLNGKGDMKRLDGRLATELLELYGLAINVYGQKEDYWDCYAQGAFGVTAQLRLERAALSALVQTVECVYLSADIRDPLIRKRLIS